MGTNHHEDRFWPKFCEITGQKHLEFDPRWDTTDKRNTNAAELVAIYDDVFKTKTRDEWIRIFRNNGFMFAPVQRLEEVLNDPQAVLNNYVVDFRHPFLGDIKLPGFPAYFSAHTTGTRAPSPKLGEHTDFVLKEIGYSENEITVLRKEGVIK